MTVAFVRSEAPGFCTQFVWTLTSADATGDAVEVPGAADKCVMIVGGAWDGGAAATCALQGSNDNTNWFSLHGADNGSAISTGTDLLQQVIENPRYIRAKLTTAGTGSTVVVTLLARTT